MKPFYSESGTGDEPVKKEHVLAGMDVGTTSIKLSLYNLQGETIFEECQEYPTHYRRPGWAEQSPRDWQQAILALLRQLARWDNLPQYCVAGMGLSVHAPSLVLLDKNGESLHEYVPIWCDERSAEQAQTLANRVGADSVGLGLPLASFPAKLLWYNEEQPELAQKASCATGVKGYLLKWLTGQLATDPSSEPGNLPRWEPLMAACGWTAKKLPPVLEATQVVGLLRDELCKQAGLPESFPVVTGLNDGACATLSAGVYRSQDASVELATNGVIYLVSEKPMPAKTRLQHAFFCWEYLEGRWIIGGQTKCGASAFAWANELFRGQAQDAAIEDYIAIAQQSPIGANGTLFFPYLRGRGTPSDQPNARAMFSGLQINTTKEDLYRSVIEGVAFSLREVADALRQDGFPMKNVFITGGGTKNQFVRQMVADVLGVPLSWSSSKATLGAALLAAVGVGAYGSVAAAAAKMLPAPTTITPNEQAYQRYQEIIRQYGEAREHLLALYQ